MADHREPFRGQEAEVVLDAAEDRIGENVRAVRSRRRWSQTELADRAGLSRGSVTGLETGTRRVTFGDLWALTRALGVDLATLVEGTGAEEDLGLAPTATVDLTGASPVVGEMDRVTQAMRTETAELARRIDEIHTILAQVRLEAPAALTSGGEGQESAG